MSERRIKKQRRELSGLFPTPLKALFNCYLFSKSSSLGYIYIDFIIALWKIWHHLWFILLVAQTYSGILWEGGPLEVNLDIDLYLILLPNRLALWWQGRVNSFESCKLTDNLWDRFWPHDSIVPGRSERFWSTWWDFSSLPESHCFSAGTLNFKLRGWDLNLRNTLSFKSKKEKLANG